MNGPDPKKSPMGFSKYKLSELALCLIAIVAGVLYLKGRIIPLSVLFPMYSAVFSAIAVLKHLDDRARGMRGVALWLPAAFSAVIALIVIAATAVYFSQLPTVK